MRTRDVLVVVALRPEADDTLPPRSLEAVVLEATVVVELLAIVVDVERDTLDVLELDVLDLAVDVGTLEAIVEPDVTDTGVDIDEAMVVTEGAVVEVITVPEDAVEGPCPASVGSTKTID